MLREELYHKTVNILVDAYFNDTLLHQDCAACAVGNIVAANIGRKVFKDFMRRDAEWSNVFVTLSDVLGGEKLQEIDEKNYKGEAKRQIDATGYTWQELAKIENAFEIADEGNSQDEWMFNGLMAVIETLDQIHENTDTELTKDTKRRFVKI